MFAGVGPVHAIDFKELISQMITAYTRSSQGVQDKVFKEKVNAIDNHLREKIEKDQ